MQIAFTLTMPGNNSWDGKWSGGGKLYAVVRHFSDPDKAREILSKKSYGYNFGDGWVASVSVREVDQDESGRLAKESLGFYGYEWMIDRIISHGKIPGGHQLPVASADTNSE